MIRIIDHEGNGYGAQAEITRKKGVNGEKSLTGVIYTNEEVLKGVDRGWKLEFENEMYAFTFALPKDTGNRIELDFDAVHEFFYDMSKSAQNNLLNDGSHTFRAYLDFIFGDTPYNYSLNVNVQAFEKQTFGQRNRLDLFYDVINAAGVEFSVNGSVVRIVDRVGNDLSTVVKKGFNLNELRLEKNIGDFVTYQKGFGAWNDEEDHSKGRLEVEYLSPLAEIYGKLDADPIVDERYAVRNNLLARLQNNVEGSYQISVQIDMEDLTRAGYEYKQPHEGDSIMAINNNLGFQRKVRIVSYETDFDIEGNILDHRITCNSVGMVEQSISNTNSIRYAINELQNDLELARQQITEARVSADGKSMNYFGPVEPTVDDYKLSIGDTWFDTSGENTVIKVWNGVEWRNAGLNSEDLQRQFEEIEQDIAEAQATADNAITEIEIAVDAAGFTSLSDSLTGIQEISQTAQSNAIDAWNNAQTALGDASTALSSATEAISQVSNIDVRVDEVEGTLLLKADSQEVNTLTGIVNNHTLDIQANAEGLALKANQDTVDTLTGTVNSLGTEFSAVAGQVNSRVWNTDIEMAIDDIEVGGRNLILSSAEISTYSETPNVALNVGNIELIEGEYYTYSFDVKSVENTHSNRIFFNNSIVIYEVFDIGMEFARVSITFQYIKNDYGGRSIFPHIYPSNNRGTTIRYPKLVKGNKTTNDWSPAPEDTLAKFDHIETEWTQTFDTFSQTVTSIDGRVTAQKQTIDSITSTVADQTGKIATVEQNVNGIQQTVSDPVNGLVTQVSTLASGFNVLVTDFENMEIGGRNLLPNTSEEWISVTIAQWGWISPIYSLSDLGLNVGEEITLTSAILTNSDGDRVALRLDLMRDDGSYIIGTIGDIVFRNERYGVSVTETIPTDQNITGLRWRIYPIESYWGYNAFYSRVRLTRGNVKVDWSPAPEDMATQAQLSVLNDNINMRVSKGELMSQINIEAGRTLIQSNKLYLDAQSVVFSGQAFIPGANIQSLSADKINAGTLNAANVRVINLDFDTAVGNRTNFIRNAWETAAGGSVTIRGSGILSTAGDGSQVYIQNGIVGARTPAGHSSGHIGVAPLGFSPNDYSIQTSWGSKFQIYQVSGRNPTTYQNTLTIAPNSENDPGGAMSINVSNIYAYSNLKVGNILTVDSDITATRSHMSIQQVNWRYGSWIYDSSSNSDFMIVGGGRLRFYTRGASSAGSLEAFRADNTHTYMYRTLSMEGHNITNQSDERLKFNIEETNVNSLEEIKSMHFVEFERTNGNHDEIGVIAQDTPSLALYDSERDMWSINSSKQIMMNSHAIQQLALREQNTNLVASQALINSETNAEKIKQLEKRIEELEGAA